MTSSFSKDFNQFFDFLHLGSLGSLGSPGRLHGVPCPSPGQGLSIGNAMALPKQRPGDAVKLH